jgi:hypothetical protein
MAQQAAGKHTPTDWGLTKVHRYLTGTLGYKKKRALYIMEQCRLAGHLPIKVQKVVDGKPQGDPFDLPTDKTHELVLDRGWVYPRGLPWSDSYCKFDCTVAEQVVLTLWPAPSALQLSEPLKPKAWLPVEHKRRQQLNDTPKDITTYAQQLHVTAVEAVGQRRLTNAPTPRRIETLLHELNLFPKIERRTKHARNTHD